jgi:hypothetical protein
MMTMMMMSFLLFVSFCNATLWQFITTSHLNRTLASGVLRGKMFVPFVQTALDTRLRSAKVECVDAAEFELETNPLHSVDICVCVKCSSVMVNRLVDRCHQRGGRFVWEVLDLPGVLSYVDYLKDTVDLWLASNRAAAAIFLAHGAQRAAVANHHHTNLLHRVSPCRQGPVRVVASTYASINQPVEFERRLTELLAAHSIEFRPVLSKFFLESEEPTVSNGWHQAAFHEGLDDVDVAVIFPPNTTDITQTVLRPVTRLAFWWSHGVPVVYFPTATYVEAAQVTNVGDELACATVECVVERILALSQDPVRRCAHAAAVLEASRHFEVQASATQFVDTVLRALDEPAAKQ